MLLTRRRLLASAATLAASPILAQGRRGEPIAFADVVARAGQLAARPFDDKQDPQPAELDRLDYDAYRKIRFRPEARIDLGAGFTLDLFHRGHIFPRRVGVNVVRDGLSTPVPYLPSEFDFGGQRIGPFPRNLGFAGLRIRYPLNRPDIQDELIVFLGASYFRFLGRGQRYGLSARGLAINAGVPGEPEEFPFFREFWIEQAKPGDRTLRLHALMDSPSLAGAYSFVVTPEERTTIEVDAALFPRVDVPRVGIAPLTSMYFTGGSGPRHTDLFRREVHDSDGLLIRREGGQVWRPLRNPRESRIASYDVEQLQAFGLIQRNRRFDDYQDLEAHYELRPSYVVEPAEDWGPGSIDLAELATNAETNDNIVASFRPRAPLAAGQSTRWRYRLIARDADAPSDIARVVRTLISDRAGPSHGKPAGMRMYLIDFAGGGIDYYRQAPEELELSLQATVGAASDVRLAWNPHTRGVRARFFAEVEVGETTEVSATLLHRGKAVSETWLGRWFRDPAREQELASGMGVR